MTKKSNESRREFVLSLRNAGLTYAEIGRRLGITGERIRQIITGQSTAKKKRVRSGVDMLLSTGQVASLLNVHVNTVRRWCNEGILKAYRVGPRGDRRIRRREIDNLLQKRFSASTN